MTGGAVIQLHAAVDALLAMPLDSLSDSELLDVVRDAEAAARRLAPVEHRLTAEVDRRGLAFAHGCADTKTLLARLLRLSAPEAKARVRAADRFCERRLISGEAVEPLHPIVAVAQLDGSISPKHAALVADTINKLPSSVDESGEVAGIEEFLVDQAKQFTPETLGIVSRRLLQTIDPDGVLRDTAYRERRRGLTIHLRSDGSVSGRFEGTAELGELLLTVFDVTAAPKPTEDGTPDPRSADQRRHDGFCDALRLVLRAKGLPSANGVVATVILTATTEQWQADTGLVQTGHGALIPTVEAKQLARSDARMFPVVLTDTDPPADWLFTSAKSIHAYGTCHRIFTETQRLAMAARDGGCTFPGCTTSVLWCEADHIDPYAAGGPTTVANGHLVCPHHHRDKVRNGWRVLMINAVPHWLAPTWLDPDQIPQRNHAHDPVGVG